MEIKTLDDAMDFVAEWTAPGVSSPRMNRTRMLACEHSWRQNAGIDRSRGRHEDAKIADEIADYFHQCYLGLGG